MDAASMIYYYHVRGPGTDLCALIESELGDSEASPSPAWEPENENSST